jgi:hypothetical protein
MPGCFSYKSKAQQRYMHAAASRGDVAKSVTEKADRATRKGAFGRIPEHVKEAKGGIVPNGYDILNEDPNFFEVKGPRGSFRVAKKGLSKRTAGELHNHFAKGGQVQKLADGAEVAKDPAPTSYEGTLGDVATSILSGGVAGAIPPVSPDATATPAERTAQGATRVLTAPLEAATATARETGQAIGKTATRIPETLARFAGYEGTQEPAPKLTPEQTAIAAAPVLAAMQNAHATKPKAEPLPAYVPVSAISESRGGGGGGGMRAAKSEISEGIDTQKQAILQSAAVEKAQAESMAKAQQDIEARRVAIRKDFEMTRADWQARGDALKQKIIDSEIDPRGFWNKKDTSGKISAGIAIMLSGIGQGLAGGQNMAMQVIDKAIERDIDAQKANLGKTQSLLAMHMQEGRDLESAYQLTKADLLDASAAQLQMTATRFAGAKAQAVAQSQVGALGVQAAQIRMQVAAQGQEMAMRGLQMDASKLQIGLARAQQRWIEQGASSPAVQSDPRWVATGQLQGWLPKGAGAGEALAVPAVGMTQVRNVSTGEVEAKPVMTNVVAADKKGAQKIRESTAGTMDALLSLDALATSWKKLGASDIALPTDAAASYDAQKVAVIGKMRLPLTGPGILTDNEVERIMKALPSKFDWSSKGQAKLNAIRENIVAANKAVVMAYALPAGRERLDLLRNAKDSLMSLEDL